MIGSFSNASVWSTKQSSVLPMEQKAQVVIRRRFKAIYILHRKSLNPFNLDLCEAYANYLDNTVTIGIERTHKYGRNRHKNT